MINILIADDHAVVREGIKQILSDSRDITVTAEAGNGDEVMRIFRKDRFDVIVLDVKMPGESGIEIIKRIKSIDAEQAILVLSMHSEENYGIRCLRAGASGFLSKQSIPGELLIAIRKVAQGRKFISEALGEILASEIDSDLHTARYKELSDREYQVLIMIASGKTVNAIAQELALSKTTISTFRARVLEKLNMTNNMELTQYAFRHDLVS